jgi:hypothetical protein
VMETPWDRATRTKSQRQEERIAKLEDGKLQVNSGRSLWTSKRDGTLGRIYKFLVEARTTDKDSYSIKRKEFLDLRKQAFQTPPGLLPMFQVDIKDLSLAVLELKDFQEFQSRMVDLEERVAEHETDGRISPMP